MIDPSAIRHRFVALLPHLGERGRRSFAAAEARSAGYGGIAAVARATGIAPSTIGRGLAELGGTSAAPADRNRRGRGGGGGGGRVPGRRAPRGAGAAGVGRRGGARRGPPLTGIAGLGVGEKP